MIFENNIKKACATLKEEGLYLFKTPVYSVGELEEVIEIQEQSFRPNDNSYEFGRASRIGSREKWFNTPIYSLFNHPVVHHISDDFYSCKPSFNEIFCTHDYQSNRGLARNGYLHFDRIPTLKFFVYLTDCDETSGPFRYVPNSYKLGKELRIKANNQTNLYESVPNRLELDYPELEYSAEDTIPLVGPAGTMFVFHSDLFHMGGIISPSKSRRVMRLHLRL
tara:strand:- start:3967 stop:4632 length:666 start_codon:yes stop_codon:yes gene_type:complete